MVIRDNSSKEKTKWSEMYQRGYDNAAISFAYIPDFKSRKDMLEFERGLKDGYAKLDKLKFERGLKDGDANAPTIKRNPGGYQKGEWVIFCTKSRYGRAHFYRSSTASGHHFANHLSSAKKYATGLSCKRAYNKIQKEVMGGLPAGAVMGMSSVGEMKTSHYYGGK